MAFGSIEQSRIHIYPQFNFSILGGYDIGQYIIINVVWITRNGAHWSVTRISRIFLPYKALLELSEPLELKYIKSVEIPRDCIDIAVGLEGTVIGVGMTAFVDDEENNEILFEARQHIVPNDASTDVDPIIFNKSVVQGRSLAGSPYLGDSGSFWNYWIDLLVLNEVLTLFDF